MSDVVGMKHYQEVYDSLCQVLHDIDVLRKYNRQFPILRVVTGSEVEVVRPDYDGNPDNCVLSPGRYLSILIALDRAHHRLRDVVVYGVVFRVTFREEEYAYENFDGMHPHNGHKKKQLKEAIVAAAKLVDPKYTPHDLLVFEATEGSTIAAAASIHIRAHYGGQDRTCTTLSQSHLTALHYDQKDPIEMIFSGEPPAGLVVVESDAYAQPAVGWGVAKENNVVLVGLHGTPKAKEHYLIWLLSQLPALAGKPLFILSDLDPNGISLELLLRSGGAGGKDYAVPHAKRIGLTRKQLAEDCDGCLKRALAPVTRRVAENMVYRADWLGSKELDDDTLEDARYVADTGVGAHAESLLLPPANSDRAPGYRGQGEYLRALLAQELQRWRRQQQQQPQQQGQQQQV